MPIFCLNKMVTSNFLGSGLNGIFVFRIWLNATVAELLEVGITFSVLSLEDPRPLLFPRSKTTNLPIQFLPTESSSPACLLTKKFNTVLSWSRPNFVWDLTWPQGRFIYYKIYLKNFWIFPKTKLLIRKKCYFERLSNYHKLR